VSGLGIRREIASEAHRRNENTGAKEGGRIIRNLISDLIEWKIVEAWIPTYVLVTMSLHFWNQMNGSRSCSGEPHLY